MRILVITQKVDSADSVLGFFVEWLNVFSKYFEKVSVICLERGFYDLPEKVSVFSLGKEIGNSRITYVINFLAYIIRERNSYDEVFVHMNQEYVLLGAVIWKILGKKILFWRNHKNGNFVTELACMLADQIYYTSKQSFTARFRNSKQMPVGVSVPDLEEKLAASRTILSLGRISPIKKVDLLVKSLLSLSKYPDFKCDVVGDPVNQEDSLYYEQVKKNAQMLVSSGLVEFFPGIEYGGVKELFQSHRFFINITPDGSLDKTIFEAMANGTIVITSNSFFRGIIPNECYLDELDPQKISQKIQALFDIPDEVLFEWRFKNRDYVLKNHSIDALVGIVADY